MPLKLTHPTVGEQCAAILKAEKQSATSAGRTMSWEEVANVIDDCVRTTPPPSKPKRAPKSFHPLFGDPLQIPPNPEWVTAYSAHIGYPVNGEAWCDSYAVKDWKVGRCRMKNWWAAARNWKVNKWGEGGIALTNGRAVKPKDYSRL